MAKTDQPSISNFVLIGSFSGALVFGLSLAIWSLCSAFTPAPTGDVLVLYNTHNWKYGDRGARICNVQLRLGQKVIWNKDGISVAFDPRESNPRTIIDLPSIKYDAIRVEVVEWIGDGGGLAEIEILRRGENIALGKSATTSAVYSTSSQCCSQMINDGIADESLAGDGVGYWLLPSGTSGWIEMRF